MKNIRVPVTIGFDTTDVASVMGYLELRDDFDYDWSKLGLAPGYNADTGELMQMALLPRDQIAAPGHVEGKLGEGNLRKAEND